MISKEAARPMKYILLWSMAKDVPFIYMGKGNYVFIEKQCPYTNCFVTSDRYLFSNYTKFDVIVFDIKEVAQLGIYNKPKSRFPHQKYVFTSIESADNYPICISEFPIDFFNWTWTYKLNSDSIWGYIVVRDKNSKVIGPKQDMHWVKSEEMDQVSDELKSQLKNKTKLAAWFASNCCTRSDRESYVIELQKELKTYNLTVDVYGKCGSLVCERRKQEKCDKMIKDDYYFYLAFENAFSEDYVTEKILNALINNAVPVVYGGANYTRFLADGMYLNAKRLSPKSMALKMKWLKENPDEYYSYFRWRNHYTYHHRNAYVDTDDYCAFCALVNNEETVNAKSSYHDIAKWWNPKSRCDEEYVPTVVNYVSETLQRTQSTSSEPYSKFSCVICILLFLFLTGFRKRRGSSIHRVLRVFLFLLFFVILLHISVKSIQIY